MLIKRLGICGGDGWIFQHHSWTSYICAGDGWRYKGHSWTSCSGTVMLSALVSMEVMGGDFNIIIGDHVAVLSVI
jgi:hypothetical protein